MQEPLVTTRKNWIKIPKFTNRWLHRR